MTGAGRGSLPSPLFPDNALTSPGQLKVQRQAVEGRGSRQEEGDREKERERGETERVEEEATDSKHQGTGGPLDAQLRARPPSDTAP